MARGELTGEEHIEVCSVCGQRYLERLPKAKGKVKYICERCCVLEDVDDAVKELLEKTDELRGSGRV